MSSISLRVVFVLGNAEERVRLLDVTSLADICAAISSTISQLDGTVVKVLVQRQHVHSVLSSKPLSVVNMCGKITHSASLYLHTPGCLPYVKKERNDFGLTDTVYTRFCNFHTGSHKTSTLFRAGTCSKAITASISHVLVLDNVQDACVTNIVYNARLGRAVAAQNTSIYSALTKLNFGPVLVCMPVEECMFVHCFKLQIEAKDLIEQIGLGQASVRINICRTGVVNFFVGLAGGLSLASAPELSLAGICHSLLQAILGAT